MSLHPSDGCLVPEDFETLFDCRLDFLRGATVGPSPYTLEFSDERNALGYALCESRIGSWLADASRGRCDDL